MGDGKMKKQAALHTLDWKLARAADQEQGPDWNDSIPAVVPGNVIDDLYRAGLVSNPYYGENFRACQWTEEWTFWYRTEFVPVDLGISPETQMDRYILHFDGIDTFGEIFLNGVSLSAVHNMFRCWRLDVTQWIDPRGKNELVVRIDPPLTGAVKWAEDHGLDLDKLSTPVFGYKERLFTRKAQMSYGWDQTPHLLGGGIFRPLYLERISGPVLGPFSWNVTDLDVEKETATLILSGRMSEHITGNIGVRGRCGDRTFEGTSVLSGDSWEVRIPVEDALFWWPNEMGAPNVYLTTISLMDANHRVLDEHQLDLGIRTVQVLTSPKERRYVDYRIGQSENSASGMDGGALGPWARVPLEEPAEVEVSPFRVFVNGKYVFIKGFDWQNTEALIGCEKLEKVSVLLEAAEQAHANMIRLWGGGTIEIDEFYKECTRRGLMVWQDFYFACGIYPLDEQFIQEVRLEATDMVERLRNHTCIAVWCGDNESDMIYCDNGVDPETNTINKRLLPEVLCAYDKQERYYHPSSPSGGPYPRSDWGGEKRNWGQWHPHGNYRHIRQEAARFISEGGSYVLPSRTAIERFMPEPVRWPLTTRTWKLHHGAVDRSPDMNRLLNLTLNAMRAHADFDDLDEAILVSQFAHAWGNKLLAERCRQQRDECGGVLLWKLSSCWPCADGMFLDYDAKPLLSLEYIAETYKTVAVSLSQDFDNDLADVELYLINDGMTDAVGTLHVIAAGLDASGVPQTFQVLKQIEVQAPSDSRQQVWRFPIDGYEANSAVFIARYAQFENGGVSYGAYSLTPQAAYRLFKACGFHLSNVASKLFD